MARIADPDHPDFAPAARAARENRRAAVRSHGTDAALFRGAGARYGVIVVGIVTTFVTWSSYLPLGK